MQKSNPTTSVLQEHGWMTAATYDGKRAKFGVHLPGGPSIRIGENGVMRIKQETDENRFLTTVEDHWPIGGPRSFVVRVDKGGMFRTELVPCSPAEQHAVNPECWRDTADRLKRELARDLALSDL